jgi:hypothetical protein
MGYEMNLNSCPDSYSCSVSCTAGKVVIGGGGECNGAAIHASRPSDGGAGYSNTGWFVQAMGRCISANVWAICANMK